MSRGSPDEWRLPTSTELLRPRPLRRLAEPFRERDFLYGKYDDLLALLQDRRRFDVIPLCRFNEARGDGRVVVGLRHDIDRRLDSALVLGRLEHARGLRATYFVLHTASYYERRDELLAALRRLQDDYGHEIGWHNDLVSLQLTAGVDTRTYLAGELAWLRTAGIDIRGVAAHGSYLAHRHGFVNEYFFADVAAPLPGFPNFDVVPLPGGSPLRIIKGTLAEFGFEYEANSLPHDRAFSDARFDGAGRRWHPARTDVGAFQPGERVIMLVHPCYWDASFAAKFGRTTARLMRRGRRLPRARG